MELRACTGTEVILRAARLPRRSKHVVSLVFGILELRSAKERRVRGITVDKNRANLVYNYRLSVHIYINWTSE